MMKLSQFPDCQTYGKLLTKINALNPTEVLLKSFYGSMKEFNRAIVYYSH
jgi:hypothetical protein